MSARPPPWMDAAFAHEDIGPLVVQWLDVATLLALRRTCRAGRAAADREFSLVDARRSVRRLECILFGRIGRDVLLMANLASRGQLRLIQWARCGERVSWNEDVTAMAAFHGHTHIIQWMCFEADPPMPYAKQHGRPADDTRPPRMLGIECANAATAGRLDVLEWLRERDFALSSEACNGAVLHGHLHVLQRICFVCDPNAMWLSHLLVLLKRKKLACNFEGHATADDHTEEEHARYKDRLRQWLPILEWYVPFANVSERRKIYEVVPAGWFLP